MDYSKRSVQVQRMFDGIAGRYDLLNHLLSGNLDRGWRRAAVRELPAREATLVLDLCGGTGDLSIALARAVPGRTVVCCDFAHGMLSRARAKFQRKRLGERCLVLEADGLRLPFPDDRFDAVTVAFGVRNFEDLDRGLREMLRVLRPGGRLVVLEFSTPRHPWLARLYDFYLSRVLPKLGDGISGRRGPYGYLAATIADFPDQPALASRIRGCGYAACEWRDLTGGIVALHTALKAP